MRMASGWLRGKLVLAVAGGLLLLPVAAIAAPATPSAPTMGRRVAAAAAAADPNAHLAELLAVTAPPNYRRFGSPGLAAAADVVAGVLGAAGFDVLRHDRPSRVWNVDYSPGHEPSLVRVADGRSFRTESAFNLAHATGPDGITCVVRTMEEVGPGECGLVPFQKVSPAWNNFFEEGADTVSAIAARGGIGAILQGDVAHNALIAVLAKREIPAVVSLVEPADVLGQTVRLRAMGSTGPTTIRNVVGVRPPSDPSKGYVLLQGHLDGWFTAAADNAAGAAAVLAAAERMAGDTGGRGLIVALYDAEEWGLRGSEALHDDLARPEGLRIGDCGPVLHLADIVAVVNLDVPSAIASDAFGAVQQLLGQPVPLVSYRVLVFSEEPALAALLTTTMSLQGALGLPVPVAIADPFNGGSDRTDIKWFHDAGIASAWPVVGYPEYHTEADTILTVDPADLERVTAGTVDLVRLIDDVPIGRVNGAALDAPGSAPPSPQPTGCVEAVTAPTTAAVVGVGGSLPATGGRGAPWWSWTAMPAAFLLLALRRRSRIAS